MHIKVKQFSLRNIVFSILLIVMLLLSCLAGTLLVSTNQNRNLVNQYVSETVELCMLVSFKKRWTLCV